jgi:predicted secreted protein
MASYEGSNGAVKVADGTGTAAAISYVRSWSITHTRDTVEATAMGTNGGFRSFKKGLESWSGSMDIVFDDAVVAEVTTSLSPSTDTVITFEGYPDVSVVATKFSGTIIVTSFAITTSFDGLTTASVSFQGTGALSGVYGS